MCPLIDASMPDDHIEIEDMQMPNVLYPALGRTAYLVANC
jgi:hypothetical protein